MLKLPASLQIANMVFQLMFLTHPDQTTLKIITQVNFRVSEGWVAVSFFQCERIYLSKS